MNSKNSEKSNPHTLLLNLSDKMNSKSSDKYVALSNLSIYYTKKNIKNLFKNNKHKIPAPEWNDTLNYVMHHFLYQNVPNCFENIIKKHETVTDNPPRRIYVNKIDLNYI